MFTASRQFKLVHPEHLRAAQPFAELTQDQRLVRAKQDARAADIANLLARAVVGRSGERRFTGEPLTGFGALA